MIQSLSYWIVQVLPTPQYIVLRCVVRGQGNNHNQADQVQNLISKFQIISLISIYIRKRRHFQIPNLVLVLSERVFTTWRCSEEFSAFEQ